MSKPLRVLFVQDEDLNFVDDESSRIKTKPNDEDAIGVYMSTVAEGPAFVPVYVMTPEEFREAIYQAYLEGGERDKDKSFNDWLKEQYE